MGQEDQKTASPVYTCPECQAGRMQLRYLTYFVQLARDFIAVPEFPAWVCDVCGRREYDQRALSWLNVILDPQTGRPGRSRHHAPHSLDMPPTHSSVKDA